jgi:beta-N-acetylhexosaminidase
LASSQPPKAVIFGCAGTVLTDAERRFFAHAQPLGFIVFQRNCETPDQLRALVADMRATLGRDDAPVLIDQEGGRVARLKPPHWRASPSAGSIGDLTTRDWIGGIEAARLNAMLIAAELHDAGITINCGPVLDLPIPGASNAIGDRAFGGNPAVAGALGGAVCGGLMAGGVLPVIKHMPGLGRAMIDSHHELPVVDEPMEVLRETDFSPFQQLRESPWGMTAHIVIKAVDDKPATQSKAVIERVIRGEIGFEGVLFSDDLSMEALAGSLGERAALSLEGGCDVVEHCNGVLGEMEGVAAAVGPLSEGAQSRIAAAEARRETAPETVDRAALETRLSELLAAP